MKMTLARAMDASAISLSALCLVHCLGLPVLALVLPFLGVWARAEWVHVAFICAAAPIALTALVDWRTLRPHAWALVALAALGLGLMLAGALEVPSAEWERPLTVVGGVILATAHILNWRRRHRAHHACP
ncbi:MerC domain-containing protein [Caulobacter sp. LARHSG274]